MSKDTFEQNNKENIAIYYIDPSDEKQSILSCRKAQVQRAVYPIILLHFCRGVVPRRHQRKDRRVPQTIGKPGKGGKRFSNGLQILDCFFFFAGFREDQNMGLFEHGGQPSNFGISWDTLFQTNPY
jgi:hypothetical protein